MKGKIFGNDWRSNEYPQFQIVSNNADADTEFSQTDGGDDSVEMDTALVILPPPVELSNLISEANETVKTAKATDETLSANEVSREAAESARVEAEAKRVSAEQARATAEAARVTAETKRETDLKQAVSDAIARAKVSVDYLPASGEISILTQD